MKLSELTGSSASRWAVSQRDAMKFSEMICSSGRWDKAQWGEMYLRRDVWSVKLSPCEKANFRWNPCRNVILSWKWGVILSARVYLRAHLWHTPCTCITGSLLRSETRPTCSYSQLFITHNASECMNTASFILYKIFKHSVIKSAVYMLFLLDNNLQRDSKLFVHSFEHTLCTLLCIVTVLSFSAFIETFWILKYFN